jgi:hypothetical protein
MQVVLEYSRGKGTKVPIAIRPVGLLTQVRANCQTKSLETLSANARRWTPFVPIVDYLSQTVDKLLQFRIHPLIPLKETR